MTERHEVVVIGAGFGGLALAHRLAETGVDDVVLLERGDGVGGTWRANTYPGAACDVPSHLYSLSFAPNPKWSRAYAGQPEILEYVERCYDQLDVKRKVRLGTEVASASWSDADRRWLVRDRAGNDYEASVLVSAVGMFHTPAVPAIPGLDDFEGPAFHSARWDHDHDLTGRRVAVIGTGASAIQVVPAIAEAAAHLDVYQRTPPWLMPRRDPAYSVEEQRAFADRPEEALLHRQQLHDLLEEATSFLADDPAMAALTERALAYLEHKVPDPELRRKLTPDYPLGCKRVLISSDYYPALQRDDVDLIIDPVERITPTGIVTADGRERPADVIVLCTGFRASDYLLGLDITGRDGRTIHDEWAGVPRAYHGIAVPGFPNFFMMYGPNTNQGGNSILLVLEAQAQFIASALAALRERGAISLEVTDEAMVAHAAELEHDLQATVWHGCRSYFRAASGDIVTQLPHTAGWYRERTADIVADDFAFD